MEELEMYILVITSKRFGFHNALTLDTIEALKVALYAFNPATGFDALLFKLKPESEIYEEIYPEDLDQ